MASLDEPYLVTSYGITTDQARDNGKQAERFKLGVTSVIYRESIKASKTGKQQSRRPIAVNTVQGNGIHLIDLSDQSPLSAFTVSPSTVFTCKAISISSESRRDAALVTSKQAGATASTSSAATSSTFRGRSRKTFVGLEQNGECQICCWTEVEDTDGTAIGDALKVSKAVDNPVVAVVGLGNTLLAFDTNGNMSFYDPDLKELASRSLGFKDSHVGRIEIVQSGNLLDADGVSVNKGPVPVYRVSVLIFESDMVDKRTSPKKSSKKRHSDAAASAPSGSGPSQRVHIVYLTICGGSIVEAGRARFPVESVIDAVQLSETTFSTLDVNGLLRTFRVDGTALIYNRPQDPLAITGITLPLLALDGHGFQLKKDILHINYARLARVSFAQAVSSPSSCLLLAAPRADRPGTVDVSLWETGLSLALARRELALPPLLLKEGLESLSVVSLPGDLVGLSYTPTPDVAGLDTQAQLTRRSTLHAMSCLAPAQMTLASVVGKRALTQQYLRETSPVSATGRQMSSTESREVLLIQALERSLAVDASARDVGAGEEAFKTWLSSMEGGEPRGKLKKKTSLLTSKQVRRILQLAVPSNLEQAVAPYIVQSLLAGKRISDSSVDGGLTFNLLERRNWDLVRTALLSCDDIPETTLVAIITVYLGPNARKAGFRYSLEKWLRLIVQIPTSPSIFRSCMKKQLSAEDVKAILQVLDHWLAVESNNIALDGSVKSLSPGITYIIPFLQALLDAHLVTLLQSDSLHPLVQSVSAHLLDAISLSSSIHNLRGPLEAFSKAQLRENERQAAAKEAVSKKAQYQDKAWSAKKALQANQLLLGDYAIESFQL